MGTVIWASSVSKRTGACINVVTMSSTCAIPAVACIRTYFCTTVGDYDCLASNIRCQDIGVLRSCVWGCIRGQVPPNNYKFVQVLGDGAAIVRSIKSSILATDNRNPVARYAVLCFSTNFPFEDLIGLVSHDGNPIFQGGPLNCDDDSHTNMFSQPRSWNTRGKILIVMGGGYRAQPRALLCPISGIKQVFMVLRQGRANCLAYDRPTAQLADISVRTSREERTEQLWWTQKFSDKTRVTVYSDEPSVLAFRNAGACQRRLLIENSQTGAFLALLFRIRPWGFNPIKVADCFILEALVYESWSRLKMQGILWLSNIRGWRLDGNQAAIFTDVLPIVDFDYQLAYLVSISASTDGLLVAKNQLVATLAASRLRVLEVDKKF
ncbi:hypothetical protein BGZ63DRAFT_86547 [Mariannaea sp. PMI_226]|nr:hypothetical protein BGZ63DRAFT_86547 [Mariannaea sp. PMI_226]